MLYYPFLVAAISLIFGGIVLNQYRMQRKAYQFWWAVSLFLGAVGTLSYILTLTAGHNPFLFRSYLLLGGLMPLYLGLGSLLLVVSRRFGDASLYLVLLGSLVGVYYFYTVPLNGAALAELNGGAGSAVITATPVLVLLGLYGGLGGLAVIGVAVYSVLQLLRRGGDRGFMVGNVMIAAGTFVIAAAGTMATTFHQDAAFWLTMFVGWVVLFGGFLLTTATAARFKTKNREV